MSDALIAYCGLNCLKCEAYLATQANDQLWKEQAVARWREEYHTPISPVCRLTARVAQLKWGPGSATVSIAKFASVLRSMASLPVSLALNIPVPN